MVAAPAFVLAACSSSSDNAAANANDNVAQFGGMSAEDLQHRYNTVYFDFDKYTIRAEDQKILDAHAELLKATNKNVTVAGHTDERGTPEYNIALGQRRADAVKGFLAGKGVDAGKVSTVSYGEEKPAVLGHDEAAYSKNRRAVLAY